MRVAVGAVCRRLLAELGISIGSHVVHLGGIDCEPFDLPEDLNAASDASPVRVRKRDAIDGRPRGHIGAFGVSRVRFRDMAHRGELPGVTKSSW